MPTYKKISKFEKQLIMVQYVMYRPKQESIETRKALTSDGAAGPLYTASARTKQKTRLPTVNSLLHVTQSLPNNGCFCESTVFALSKYATIQLPECSMGLSVVSLEPQNVKSDLGCELMTYKMDCFSMTDRQTCLEETGPQEHIL
jgi:hypothetical protein